jgi:hypothetical protein
LASRFFRPREGRLISHLIYSSLLLSTLIYSYLLLSTLIYSSLLFSTLIYSYLLFSTLIYSSLLLSTLPPNLLTRAPPPPGQVGVDRRDEFMRKINPFLKARAPQAPRRALPVPRRARTATERHALTVQPRLCPGTAAGAGRSSGRHARGGAARRVVCGGGGCQVGRGGERARVHGAAHGRPHRWALLRHYGRPPGVAAVALGKLSPSAGWRRWPGPVCLSCEPVSLRICLSNVPDVVPSRRRLREISSTRSTSACRSPPLTLPSSKCGDSALYTNGAPSM